MPHRLIDELPNHAAPSFMSEPPTQLEHRDTVAEAFDGLDLQRRMTEHPYQTMLIAVGVGYVLGGGLFTAFTARAVSAGARVALLPLLQRGLIDTLESVNPAHDA
jgi:hypothetical protein